MSLATAPAIPIPFPGYVFLNAIQSIKDILPAAPSTLGLFDLTQRVAVGDNLDFALLISAEALVEHIRE